MPDHNPTYSNSHMPYTVLYVEDNPANMRLVEIIMKRRPSITLIPATEAQQGIERATAAAPDLILLDITLPGMDGFQVLKHLQNAEPTQKIPVIAVSANSMPKDIDRGMEAGFADYITKPIDVNHFLQVVDQFYGLKQGAA